MNGIIRAILNQEALGKLHGMKLPTYKDLMKKNADISAIFDFISRDGFKPPKKKIIGLGHSKSERKPILTKDKRASYSFLSKYLSPEKAWSLSKHQLSPETRPPTPEEVDEEYVDPVVRKFYDMMQRNKPKVTISTRDLKPIEEKIKELSQTETPLSILYKFNLQYNVKSNHFKNHLNRIKTDDEDKEKVQFHSLSHLKRNKGSSRSLL